MCRLSIVCLSALLGCTNSESSKKAQSTDIGATVTPTPSVSSPIQNPPAQIPTSSSSSDEFAFPVSLSPVPVIPSVVTPTEVAMREGQIKIAQDLKEYTKRLERAGVGTRNNVRRADYFVFSNQIQLLQAKQALQLKQQQEKSKNSLSSQ
ncbi:hypothetical protein CAL7716_060170 [Calothrix sp. PCC 7716]|nr:hypothetical protein CAL7716_060170 [Calothrix sp. PCC 7716]